MSIRKISEFVEATSPQNSDKLLIERNGSGKSITVGNLLNDVVTRTRVNLLRPSLVTTTKNGVTCTNNGDGTYTINGTASEYAEFIIGSVHIKKDKKYRIVGCPSGGTFEPEVGYKLFIAYDDVYAVDYGEAETFEPTKESISDATIQINTGTVCDNLLFKPMITDDLSATYDDFVSYDDSFVKGINSGIKLDLLWANASPYSAFPDQTLSLDLNKYKVIAISVNDYGTDPYRRDITQVHFILKNVSSHIFSTYLHQDIGSIRVASASDDGISFSGATDTSGNVNNATTIPQKIWGIM